MTEMEEVEILEVVRLGHPVLREKAKEIPTELFGTDELREFSDLMINTMFASSGVGLAAPQVAKGWRCFVFHVPGDPDGDEPFEVPPTFIANPEIFPANLDQIMGWEGCLSIPGLRGLVPRFDHIKVKGFDRDGNEMEFEAEGFHSRVIQHEYDHLEGVIFMDRMQDMASLCFEEEWEEYVLAPLIGDEEDDG